MTDLTDHQEDIILKMNEINTWEHLSLEEKIDTLHDYLTDVLRDRIGTLEQTTKNLFIPNNYD